MWFRIPDGITDRIVLDLKKLKIIDKYIYLKQFYTFKNVDINEDFIRYHLFEQYKQVASEMANNHIKETDDLIILDKQQAYKQLKIVSDIPAIFDLRSKYIGTDNTGFFELPFIYDVSVIGGKIKVDNIEYKKEDVLKCFQNNNDAFKNYKILKTLSPSIEEMIKQIPTFKNFNKKLSKINPNHKAEVSLAFLQNNIDDIYIHIENDINKAIIKSVEQKLKQTYNVHTRFSTYIDLLDFYLEKIFLSKITMELYKSGNVHDLLLNEIKETKLSEYRKILKKQIFIDKLGYLANKTRSLVNNFFSSDTWKAKKSQHLSDIETKIEDIDLLKKKEYSIVKNYGKNENLDLMFDIFNDFNSLVYYAKNDKYEDIYKYYLELYKRG